MKRRASKLDNMKDMQTSRDEENIFSHVSVKNLSSVGLIHHDSWKETSVTSHQHVQDVSFQTSLESILAET